MAAIELRTPEMQLKKQRFALKFGLYVAIISMTMVFAGFTSAYIVKKSDLIGWQNFYIPGVFTISTLVILLSSATMFLAKRAVKQLNIKAYRRYIGLTTLLGIGFIVLQVIGWDILFNGGIYIKDNISGSFFYIISGMHIAHVLGGLVALMITWYRTNRKIRKRAFVLTESNVSEQKFKTGLVEVYWHFVDILWLYLFGFLLINHM